MNDANTAAPEKGGELTLKQAGIMLLVITAILGAVHEASTHGILTTHGEREAWTIGGIPLIVVVGIFGVAGLALTVLGIVKKS